MPTFDKLASCKLRGLGAALGISIVTIMACVPRFAAEQSRSQHVSRGDQR